MAERSLNSDERIAYGAPAPWSLPMTLPPDSGLYAMMFVAGCAVPTMAAINAALGARLASPVAAVLVLCCIAALASTLILIALNLGAGQRPSPAGGLGELPAWQLLGGALFVVYILSATIAVPRIGLGNAIFMVLIGQLVTAAVIDHFGLLGAPVAPISWRRAAGLAIMVVGVALARRDVVPATGG